MDHTEKDHIQHELETAANELLLHDWFRGYPGSPAVGGQGRAVGNPRKIPQ